MTSVPVQDPVFGDPALSARFIHHQVKGNLLAARPRYVRERWGEDGVRGVVERLTRKSEPYSRARFSRSPGIRWTSWRRSTARSWKVR